jgi:hypothetical protein
MSGDPAEPMDDSDRPAAFDSEAVAWAYAKLLAFGVHNGKPESAMMMDRLKLLLVTDECSYPACMNAGMCSNSQCAGIDA